MITLESEQEQHPDFSCAGAGCGSDLLPLLSPAQLSGPAQLLYCSTVTLAQCLDGSAKKSLLLLFASLKVVYA